MKIYQITSGWDISNTQIGVAIGEKYLHLYELTDGQWKKYRTETIDKKLEDLIDSELYKSAEVEDLAKFRQNLFEIITKSDF